MVEKNTELEKLQSLILSGLEENITLAFTLAEGVNLQPEFNIWLKEEFEELIILVAKDKYNGKACRNFVNNGYDWENTKDFITCLLELSGLTKLSLNRNKITELPESISKLTNLQYLNLERNQLIQLPESIGKLSNLTTLLLWKNQITELPESIGKLTNLKELDLNWNQLTELPKSIGNIINLTMLNLWKNELTELPESIGKLTNLTRLWLRDNPITEKEKEKERIKKALPNCNINF